MKNIIIAILTIATIGFAYIALKDPKCEFKFKDVDGSTLCAVRK